MKQRITYVVTKPESFNPEQIQVQKHGGNNGDTFTISGVNAAKEHRITLGLDELPPGVNVEIIKRYHEIHARWASDTPYSVTPPFNSRVSPGLHVFFTASGDSNGARLCSDVHEVFGDELKCTSSNETAIKMPKLSERFSMSTASQYYAPLSAEDFTKTGLARWGCPYKNEACARFQVLSRLASYIDIDYDAISQAVVLTAVWSEAPGRESGWTETTKLSEKESTVEIGVLAHEPNTDPEDVQFGGFLTVLGRDDKPKPTRFQTPTRHYPLLTPDPYNPNSTPSLSALKYTTSLQRPTGLHPTLSLSFPTAHLTPPDSSCKLHTHLTLPSALFIDKYQFSDPLFLASKNLVALRSIAGATDLEAPDWVTPQWGSAALFELASPPSDSSDSDSDASASPSAGEHWNVSIPLHLRYLPASASSHASVGVPWPVVFWACRADEGEKMSANPFDRRHLGYEALFGPKTRFMHVEPVAEETLAKGQRGARHGKMVEWIDVPVLDTRKAAWVESGTVGVVIVAFLGLCWVLFGKVGGSRTTVEKGKKKQ